MRWEVTVVAGPDLPNFAPANLSLVFSKRLGSRAAGALAQQALLERWPGSRFTLAGVPLENLDDEATTLRQGDIILRLVGTPSRRTLRTQSRVGPQPKTDIDAGSIAPAQLSVLSGPAAGFTFPLERGHYSLGRGNCDLVLADPTLSRSHLTLEVASSGITITPVSGVEDLAIIRGWELCSTASPEAIRGATRVRPGDLLLCGNSGIQLDLAAPVGAVVGNQVFDNSDGNFLSLSSLEPQRLAATAAPSRGRTALVIAGILPLAIGITFAFLMSSWIFLAFAAMGACTLLLPLLGGSKERRQARESVRSATLQAGALRQASFPAATSLLKWAQSTQTCTRIPQATDRTRLGLRLGTTTLRPELLYSSGQKVCNVGQLHHVPFAIALGRGNNHVVGPIKTMRSLLHFVLMQLDVADVPVIVCADSTSELESVRFLSQTTLCSSPVAFEETLSRLSAPKNPPPLTSLATATGPAAHSPKERTSTLSPVVIVAPVTGQLIDSSHGMGWPYDGYVFPPELAVLYFNGLPSSSGSETGQAAESPLLATISAQGVSMVQGHSFTADGVESTLFDRFARLRGQPCSSDAVLGLMLPCTVPSAELAKRSVIHSQWQRNEYLELQAAQIGSSDSGVEHFDFAQHGPHLLIAGTTGSGKSEFLRTIVGSLATLHSPSALTLLLIDFKGGAGLQTLTSLPHAVSLVTDLQGDQVERMLESLRAEIRKREFLFSSAGCADVTSYRRLLKSAAEARNEPSEKPLPYLVIAIDEFRVLVDQFPNAMAELMRIAAVGRSLGIHLIMATQRPQGAINADIRANVSSTICLRVQSQGDSQDVIGSSAAASISPANPGRAFISRAGEGPVEFQAAMLAIPTEDHGTVEILSYSQSPSNPPHSVPNESTRSATESDVESVCSLLRETWQSSQMHVGLTPVVAAPLPAANQALSSHARLAPSPHTGVLDVPETQKLFPFLWDPELHSHLSIIGSNRETSNAARTFLQQQLNETYSGKVIYILDADNNYSDLGQDPAVNLRLGLGQLRYAARLLQLLATPADAAMEQAAHSQTTPNELLAPGARRYEILICTNWDKWATAFRASPWHWAEDLMQQLLRDTSGKTTILVTGGRVLFGSPMMSEIPNRLFLPHGSSHDSTMLWPRLPMGQTQPLRGTIFGAANASISGSTAENGHQLQVFDSVPCTVSGTASSSVGPPPNDPQVRCATPHKETSRASHLRILPKKLSVKEVLCFLEENFLSDSAPADYEKPLILGLGGDRAQLLQLHLQAASVLPVVITKAQDAGLFSQSLAALNPGLLTLEQLRIRSSAQGSCPESKDSHTYLVDSSKLIPNDLGLITKALNELKVTVILLLPPDIQSLFALPVDWGLRNPQLGLIIGAERSLDGEILGLRIDTQGNEPSGRGVLIERGKATWFQFPTESSNSPL